MIQGSEITPNILLSIDEARNTVLIECANSNFNNHGIDLAQEINLRLGKLLILKFCMKKIYTISEYTTDFGIQPNFAVSITLVHGRFKNLDFCMYEDVHEWVRFHMK